MDARTHNRAMVLQRLFHDGPLSRADLARATGLTRVTVSDQVASLMADGLVAELGLRSEGKVGKPGTLVGLRTEAFQVVAVDLADDARDARRGPRPVRRRPAAPVGAAGRAAPGRRPSTRCSTFCRELVAAATQPVLGVGVGSPGRRSTPTGAVVEAPNRRLVRPAAGRRPCPSARAAGPRRQRRQHRRAWGSSPTAARAARPAGAHRRAGRGCRHRGRRLARPGRTGTPRARSGTSPRSTSATTSGRRTWARRSGAPAGGDGCLETVLSVPALRRRTAGLDDEATAAALAAVGRRLGIVLAPVVSALEPLRGRAQRSAGAAGRAPARRGARDPPRTHHARHQQPPRAADDELGEDGALSAGPPSSCCPASSGSADPEPTGPAGRRPPAAVLSRHRHRTRKETDVRIIRTNGALALAGLLALAACGSGAEAAPTRSGGRRQRRAGGAAEAAEIRLWLNGADTPQELRDYLVETFAEREPRLDARHRGAGLERSRAAPADRADVGGADPRRRRDRQHPERRPSPTPAPSPTSPTCTRSSAATTCCPASSRPARSTARSTRCPTTPAPGPSSTARTCSPRRGRGGAHARWRSSPRRPSPCRRPTRRAPNFSGFWFPGQDWYNGDRLGLHARRRPGARSRTGSGWARCPRPESQQGLVEVQRLFTEATSRPA